MKRIGLLAVLALGAGAGAQDEGTIRLGLGGRITYLRSAAPYKAYASELRTPAGVQVLADSPPDHVHHHGLMLALGVDSSDFWGEGDPKTCGKQVETWFQPEAPAAPDGSYPRGIAQGLQWVGGDGVALLEETRVLHPWLAVPGCSCLEWRSTLRLAEGRAAARLWGRHYFGLGMRLDEQMNGAAEFLNDAAREGDIVRGDERLTRARWVALHSAVGGKKVTVALFDHPLNPRHPAHFFTMAKPFAYLCATLNLHVQERVLRAGEFLDLRYCVAAWDQHIAPEVIEAAYRRWVARAPLAGLENVALASAGTRALASSEFGPDYAAAKAIDGRWTSREHDKWNSARGITPHFLRLDLGRERRIEAVVLRHEGALPLADAFRFDASDYRLQRSARPWGPWIDLVPPVRGNSDDVSVHFFSPVSTRYVRIFIETAEQGGRNEYGRIAEVEVYAAKE